MTRTNSTYAAALSRRFISLASQNFNDLRTHMESCQSHAQESSAQPTYTLYTEGRAQEGRRLAPATAPASARHCPLSAGRTGSRPGSRAARARCGLPPRRRPAAAPPPAAAPSPEQRVVEGVADLRRVAADGFPYCESVTGWQRAADGSHTRAAADGSAGEREVDAHGEEVSRKCLGSV